jgi:hypothetical protein
MPYTIEYEEAGYILLTGEGEARLKDLQEAIVNGRPMVKERHCYRVLSDFRKLHLTLSIMDLFSIPSMQASLAKEFNTPFYRFRRAVLVPPQDYDKYKFFENVAVNRSHVVKVFLEKEQAVSWLLQ